MGSTPWPRTRPLARAPGPPPGPPPPRDPREPPVGSAWMHGYISFHVKKCTFLIFLNINKYIFILILKFLCIHTLKSPLFMDNSSIALNVNHFVCRGFFLLSNIFLYLLNTRKFGCVLCSVLYECTYITLNVYNFLNVYGSVVHTVPVTFE